MKSSNSTEVLSNVSYKSNFDLREETTISLWFLICYYGFTLLGVIINLVVFVALARCKRNGILSSILQLIAIDVLSTYVVLAETWSINQQTWFFSMKLCSFYLASEVLFNTFVIYQTICLNLHIISTVNLRMLSMEKDSRNPLTSCNENDEVEDFFLTASENRTSNRNVVIDYRKEKTDLSIVLPSILVWFICLSISVPHYTLSQAISVNNCVICTIVDIYYRQLFQNIVMIFRTAFPFLLSLILVLVLIKKLYDCKYSSLRSQNLLSRKLYDVQVLLTLGLFLIIIYIVMSLQRQLFYLIHAINQDINDSSVNSFKMPPLENIACSHFTNIISAMIHYGSSTVRGITYMALIPEIKHFGLIKKLLPRIKH